MEVRVLPGELRHDERTTLPVAVLPHLAPAELVVETRPRRGTAVRRQLLGGAAGVARADTVTLGPATQTVNEDAGAGAISFTVTRTGSFSLTGTDATVTVALGGAGDTASCPDDVKPTRPAATPCSETVDLPAIGPLGQPTTATATFDVVQDALDEADETITATIVDGGGMGAGTPASASATIADDDPPPTIALGAGSVTEGTGATPSTLALPLTLSAASGRAVSVGYTVAPGTADASDASLAGGTVTIPAGQTTGAIAIAVTADAVDEDDETLAVTLTDPPTGATIAPGAGTATGTILDDDTAQLVVGDVARAEGTGGGGTPFTFPVGLTIPAAHPVTVSYATADGTATAGSDYVATSGTLTFAPGEQATSVTVPVVPDATVEPNESFALVLSGATGATIAPPGGGVATIRNDDAYPVTPVTIPAGGSMKAGGGGADRTAPKGTLTRITTTRGTLRTTFACPSSETSCKATVTVFTVPTTHAKVKALRRERKLGATTTTVAGGGKAKLAIKLTKATRALLRRGGTVTVKAFAVVTDAAGNVGTTTAGGRLRVR